MLTPLLPLVQAGLLLLPPRRWALETMRMPGAKRFERYADVVIGKYFWKHSYTADTYAEGRVTLATNVNPKKVLFTNLNLDDAKELVIAESLKFLVLTPSCP